MEQDTIEKETSPDSKQDQDASTQRQTPLPKEDSLLYGWGPWKPRWAQSLNTLPFYVTCMVIYYLGYSMAGASLAVGIPHIEKQFGLSSTKSAVMSSSSDFGSISIMIFISYLGTKYNMATIFSVGAFLCGTGGLLMSIPHYLTGSPNELTTGETTSNMEIDICPLQAPNSTSNNTGSPVESAQYTAYGIMVLGELLRGFGTATSATSGQAFIDVNGKYPTTAVYFGITYASASISNAISIILGGYIVDHMYVDFDTVDKDNIPDGPDDPKWIGAWWILFLGGGAISLLMAVPIFGFPRSLPGAEAKGVQKEEKIRVQGESNLKLMKNYIWEFLTSSKKLLLNGEYLLVTLGEGVTGFGAQGIGVFSIKYFTQMYDLSNQDASYITSGRAVMGGIAGILGGVIIRRFKLTGFGIERFNASLLFVGGLFALGLLARCPNIKLSGVEVPYPGENVTDGLLLRCQYPCQCQGQLYDPVCGADDAVYYSACHAGCKHALENGTYTLYTNCSCVGVPASSSRPHHTATVGPCVKGCYGVYISTTLLFLASLLQSMSFSNTAMATLRCVDQGLRPFALGLQMLVSSLIGYIPSPLLIGAILDSTCRVWSDPIQGEGTQYCQVYDRENLSYGFTFVVLTANFVGGLLFLAASFANKVRAKKDEKSPETTCS